MKKINSIHFGGKIIGIGLLFLIPVPLLLFAINQMIHIKLLGIVIVVSLIIGGVIEGIMMILLIIELNQDRKLNHYYIAHRQDKILLGEGKYECGVCGNRYVKVTDTYCTMCGKKFTIPNK